MLIVLVRKPQSEGEVTKGRLFLQDEYFCDTIEPAYEGNQYCEKGCIPFGFYNIVVTDSPKFSRPLPWITRVTGYSGIRIHAGSKPEHTKGCILIPKEKEQQLVRKLTLAEKQNGQNFIMVTDSSRIVRQLQNGAKVYLEN